MFPNINESESSDDTETNPVNIEITIATLKAFNFVDQMKGSISDFEDLVQFAKEVYCKSHRNFEERWPRNWGETQTVLKIVATNPPENSLSVCMIDTMLSGM